MTHFQLPTIRGTIEQQLKQIVSYLTNQAEKLNYNVDNSSAEKIFEQAVQAVSSNTDKPDKDYYDSRYASLKSLIIKTADEVIKQEDSRSLTLTGEYLAKSEFGEYFEKATVNIEGNPYGITQLYNYATNIKTDADKTKSGFEEYTTKTKNYINMGYLDTSGSSPTFGIEVGLLADTFKVTDSSGKTQTITNSSPHKIRITPGRISLFSNGYEAAWITEKSVYFPNANITGGTINISSGTFKVDNKGNLTATSGSIAGWNIGKGSLCYPNDNAIYKSTSADSDGYRYEVGIKSEMGSVNYNNFYVARYNTKDGTNKRVFAVNNSGAILATKGTIGGWEILEKRISSANNDGVYSVIQSEGSTFLATGLSSADSTNGSNAKFIVYHNGTLKATQAEITGKITATIGSIAGWNIGKGSLCYPNDNAIYKSTSADSDGYRYEVGIKSEMGSVNYNNFYVARYNTKDGTNKRVFAVNNSGAILATKGTIGGWEILEKRISSANNDGVYSVIQSEGSTFLATGLSSADSTNGSNAKFIVYHNGTLKATQAEITGKITATSGSFTGSIYANEGTIGGFTTNDKYMITTGKSDFGIAECLYFNPKGSVAARKIGGISTAISGWTIASGTNFGVTKNGNLYAKNARIDGTIIASEGSIGGWDIDNNGIVSTKSDFTVALYNFANEGNASRVLYCYDTVNSKYTFKLLRNGNLYATDVNLTGTINATSGTIGGFIIGDPYMITTGKSDFGIAECLYFNPKGSVAARKIGGISTAISGWTIASGNNFGVTKNGNLYAKNARIDGTIISSAGCIGGFDIGSFYIVTSGKDWGTNGSLLLCATGSSGSKSIGGSSSQKGWVITAGNNFGVTNDGYVFCKGAAMTNAYFYDETIFFDNINLMGHIFTPLNTMYAWTYYDTSDGVARLSYQRWATTGTVSNQTAFYIGVLDWTMRLQAKSVQLKDGAAVTSDARLKTEIQSFSDMHETLFMNLSPKTYKYIEGTSNRTHFGFIAQEMETAILESGLTTQDVAAFVSIESDRDGFEGYELSIRYSEIVSLNTYMIQKCLNKIKALEDEIILLKNERTA